MVTRLASTQALERTTIQALGLRALWLHLQLTGVEALALAPRDRELITLVATRPRGVPLSDLLTRMRTTSALNAEAGRHWIQRLVDQVSGWFVPAVIGVAVLAFIAWAIWGPEPRFSFGLVAAVSRSARGRSRSSRRPTAARSMLRTREPRRRRTTPSR